MNDTRKSADDAAQNGFSKLAPLAEKVGGDMKPAPENDTERDPLLHAPHIPSAENVARATIPEKAAGEQIDISRSDLTQVPEVLLRDPLFAARILAEERAAVEPLSADGRDAAEKPRHETRAVSPREESGAPRIRTYQSDVAGALKKQQSSVIQMVLAEQGRKQEEWEQRSPAHPKNLALIVVSALLVAAGAGAAGFAAWRYATTQETKGKEERAIEAPSIIFAEEKKKIDITDLTKDRIGRLLSAETKTVNIRLDFVEQFYIVKTVEPAGESLAQTEPVETLVSAPEFFAAIQSGMPESLVRALDQVFFFGVHAFNGNQPFLILLTDYFESTFAGMLSWESTIARDILPLFGGTATPDLVGRPFEDIVIKNRDFRALRDADGNIVLLYIFYDKNTVVVATAEETVQEVTQRLNREPAR